MHGMAKLGKISLPFVARTDDLTDGQNLRYALVGDNNIAFFQFSQLPDFITFFLDGRCVILVEGAVLFLKFVLELLFVRELTEITH